jgi:excisionase family DNA binding protein
MESTESRIERLMTVPELSNYLQISPLQIYKMTSLNTIPYKKIGRRVRFSKTEIDDFINKNSSGTGHIG